jgi:hypothetical protein
VAGCLVRLIGVGGQSTEVRGDAFSQVVLLIATRGSTVGSPDELGRGDDLAAVELLTSQVDLDTVGQAVPQW